MFLSFLIQRLSAYVLLLGQIFRSVCETVLEKTGNIPVFPIGIKNNALDQISNSGNP